VSAPAIATRGLTKFYEARAVVRELTWEVPVGAACALLGPNGAGKSTTLKLLLGFTPPSAGEMRILGEDPWELAPATRARIGYVAEKPILPPWIRVDRLIRFHASLYPRWDHRLEKELGQMFAIAGGRRVSELSKGQNRSLMLLLALCQAAELLILDEPASGLDVAARRAFLGLLADWLAEGGRTLVISSHLLTDVERLASHVAILRQGELVEHRPLDELKQRVKQVRLPIGAADQLTARLSPSCVLAKEEAGRGALLTLRLDGPVERLLGELPPDQVEVIGLPLEEIYLALTGANGAPR
jgi:ABC-2 type transport system ATP-binding protein